ncbi:ABC transporter ATP-binding protein [Methanobrevibacter oralis]|uniref:ABC transporter ATP-binding protein n=1 Tax=Methanobrevibacter oralis TaxID=66851 RepID=UPI001C731998|nr:ABC transporter ATP-binding protein [Methanobrevibacter oralis]
MLDETLTVKYLKKRNLFPDILILLKSIFEILPILFVVYIINKIMFNSIDFNNLLFLSIFIVVFSILKSFFYGLSIWKTHEKAYEMLVEIRLSIIKHLKKLSLGFFQDKKIGNFSNIINHDVEQIELYLAHALPEINSLFLIQILIVITILFFDWRLALSLVSTIPIIFILKKLTDYYLKDSVRKFTESSKQMSENLVEYINTVSVIKAFSNNETKTDEVLMDMKDYIKWVKSEMLNITIPMSLISFFSELGLVLLIIIGSNLLVNGKISVMIFILSIILAEKFSKTINKLPTFQHFNIILNESIRKINTILSVNPLIKSDLVENPKNGDIIFSDVDFSYNGDEKVLFDINMTFKENSKTGIIGSSGSGKTTIANLIMGFWKVGAGSITIDGVNINNISEKNLSNLISIVQQDVFLFNLSIEENIRIGKPDASKKEIIEAAKKARIHDFIISLKDGYDTLLGENGVKFSGGEKQRISIARMILKNSPIIILDEATSAIDPDNEFLIHDAINSLGKDKTLIIIAHYLNTIKNLDNIFLMDRGEVICSGKHDTLLNCQKYREMLNKQNQVDNWQIKEV